jgi:hypothetical protein
LVKAKSHAANVVVHVEAHFTRAKTIATADAAKVQTDADTMASLFGTAVKADVAKVDTAAAPLGQPTLSQPAKAAS